ncbi:exported hypothetical protein [Candidatus Terasakiella magnetica]|uniref:Uncharacterized protein n=1 Tax=Candidatus Terasakiella magnetica TaxID=1867952 RepID=A0A1C3RJ61_9PROT|nr:hypothetical protein [Candidatus Terasakiella magnetica]SCA57300.1 exported hypothetical protein [Candidatus Terasakiella magnetica]
MKKITLALIATFFAFNVSSALAVEAYTEDQQQEFTSWCTGTKSNSEPMCNCALKQVMQTVAPATLATFLANGGEVSFSQTSVMTAAAVTQALTSCSK